MKQNRFIKFLLLPASIGIAFFSINVVKADTNSYRLYNPNSGEHFWTISANEKQSLVNAGWKYESVAWCSVSSGKTLILRVYNPNSGEHFYTTSKTEENSLVHVGWKADGTLSYSSGAIPVYRLYDGKFHFYTTSVAEKNTLAKTKGWHYEGIAFYSIAPEYNWHYDATQSSQSGVAGDVHFPQFDYLTSTEAVTQTYQGNNIFYAYNDAVFNFNAQLQADAKSADYANAQARLNWTNAQNKDSLAVSNAKAALDTATTKKNEAQTLVNQAQADVTADQQNNLDPTQDQALLTQYQTNLTTATAVYNTDNTTYQNAVNTLNTLNKQGTNFVRLSYSVSLSNGGKTVKVNFAKTTRTSGVNNVSGFSRSATLAAG